MKYTEILENGLLPFIQLHEQDKVIFQQHNVAIYTLLSMQRHGLPLKISIF